MQRKVGDIWAVLPLSAVDRRKSDRLLEPVFSQVPEEPQAMEERMAEKSFTYKLKEARAGKYLTFMLASEEYGVSVIKVREIIGVMPITPLPRTPNFMKGIVNLRSSIVPVFDLRLKFGMDQAQYDKKTCIIVIDVDALQNPVGILVDSVSEVLDIKEDRIEDMPEVTNTLSDKYVLGMAKTDSGIKILLDINRVIRDQDTAIISAA